LHTFFPYYTNLYDLIIIQIGESLFMKSRLWEPASVKRKGKQAVLSAVHWLHPLHLFNAAVLELQAGEAPEGRFCNASR
jgi:hypothetical protein